MVGLPLRFTQFPLIKIMDHTFHVATRFRIRWDAVIAVYGCRPRIVSGQGESNIFVIIHQQRVQIGRSAGDILFGRENCHARPDLSRWPASSASSPRTDARNRMNSAIAFRMHNAGQQVGIKMMFRASLMQQRGNVT